MPGSFLHLLTKARRPGGHTKSGYLFISTQLKVNNHPVEIINSTGWIAPVVQGSVNELSRWCLVISISALGMKTRLKELAAVGIKPILLMVGETVFLVVLVLLLLHWGL